MSEMHERLRAAREKAGFKTAAEAARRFGWNEPAYRHHENGTSGFRRDRAFDYAQAFNVPVHWLMFGSPDDPQPLRGAPDRIVAVPQWLPHASPDEIASHPVKKIPVVGEVAAGVWREVLPVERHDIVEELPIGVEGYDSGRLYALKVVGPSMNMHYPDGRYVIVAPADEVEVRDGDHVVVRRTKAGLYETTIKHLVKEADGRIALWPRSMDPQFQSPIYLETTPEDQDGPEIVGVVIADYGKVRRPPSAIR